jgi:hypothetical protein
MPEKAGAILEKVPDNQDVQTENDSEFPSEAGRLDDSVSNQFVMVNEFEHFNGNEKRRFADRQPPRPGNAENQSHAFH